MTMATQTHWKKLHNPDYLGAYSIEPPSTEMIVTIDRVAVSEIVGADGKKDAAMVMTLKGQKPMVLNATNAKALTKIFGTPFVEEWNSKTITLYIAKVKAFGDVVDALRIRAYKAPEVKLPELTPTHPKWTDAKKAVDAGNTTIESIRKSYMLSVEHETLLTTKP